MLVVAGLVGVAVWPPLVGGNTVLVDGLRVVVAVGVRARVLPRLVGLVVPKRSVVVGVACP